MKKNKYVLMVWKTVRKQIPRTMSAVEKLMVSTGSAPSGMVTVRERELFLFDKELGRLFPAEISSGEVAIMDTRPSERTPLWIVVLGEEDSERLMYDSEEEALYDWLEFSEKKITDLERMNLSPVIQTLKWKLCADENERLHPHSVAERIKRKELKHLLKTIVEVQKKDGEE